jgi:hypothetical protein
LAIKPEGGDLLVGHNERRSPVYRDLLRDALFLELLLTIDREALDRARAGRCSLCGGPLHAAHFERKPRGPVPWPGPMPDGYEVRFDLCCGWCRRRTMPVSVRFLGRRVYLGVVVALATVVVRGLDRGAVRSLQRALGVARSTLERWRAWWRTLPGSGWWQCLRGVLPLAVDPTELPSSLLAVFSGGPSERMLRLLRLLRPISGGVVSGQAG